MTRRRSSAKNRDVISKPKSLKKVNGKLKRWNTRGDIEMNDEDQFHDSREKILLEGGNYGEFDDEDGDDDEIFALKGLLDNNDEVENQKKFWEDSDKDEEDETLLSTEKRKSLKRKKGNFIPSEEDTSQSEEEEEETWGRGRAAYYSSNADQLESDDDEGNALEEQEAKKLQAKVRQGMKDEDFGLNDNPELEKEIESDDILDSVPSILPALPTDKKSLLRHLEKTDPLSLALARDWDDSAHKLRRLQLKIESNNPNMENVNAVGLLYIHYQALLSYIAVLGFYLHLRSTKKYAERPTLLESHPIIERLLTLKQALQTFDDLEITGSSDTEDELDDYDLNMDDMSAAENDLSDLNDDLDPDELSDLLMDAHQPIVAKVTIPEEKTEQRPKKKRKIDEDNSNVVSPVFDLVEPEFTLSKAPQQRTEAVEDAYGEFLSLHSVDAADKTARKKTLRFHTSKIANASARREGARNQAAGGDDDIPYQEKKKDRDARLVKEAAKLVKNQGGADLNDDEPEPLNTNDHADSRSGKKRSRESQESHSDDESPDDYYELVKKRTKLEKSQKQAEYEESHGSTRIPLEEGGISGQRSLTRAILSNKGLTPHRPKSVRNPRVKKRQKYEKAKKKVASQKAVFKGGLLESHGKYEGEKSGISKVVKSVRLS